MLSTSDTKTCLSITPDQILYEDSYLIAVNKPAGLPTQPTLDKKRQNLFDAVKSFFTLRDNPEDAYLGMPHRLDVETSGVVLFTKSREVNPAMAQAFSKRLIQKKYIALIEHPADFTIPEYWEIKNYLGRDKTSKKIDRFVAVRSGGKCARTEFKLLKSFAHTALIEATPHTGRTHQIRAHLSGYQTPILGDTFYGATHTAPRVMLHALNLRFLHPANTAEICIEAPVPRDFKAVLLSLS
ncbi:MAG: RluA family pseudouridine synthase [Deltaproteobacteria bacterium]|nr:RluA family pseudouridine synthase [Deltaproteobacteria bacterium]